MKEYMLLHCKYFGNMCQKPKKKREAPPFERGKKSSPTTAMAAKAQHLFLSAKEPSVYFGNKAITNSQSCLPKKFSSI